MREPWFRKQNQCWYVFDEATKKQVRLDPDKEKAFTVWAELRAANNCHTIDSPVASILEAFGNYSEAEHSPTTSNWYALYLVSFTDHVGLALRVRDLKPLHITKWVQSQQQWGPSSQRAAITTIKTAMSWALAQGMITNNPIAKVKAPGQQRRTAAIEHELHGSIAGKAKGRFRSFLIALWHTGCRPGEVAKVTAANVSPDGGAWVLQEHKTRKKTGKPRIVYLTPCMVLVTRLLVAANPTGPLFRNDRGQPWKRQAIAKRFNRLQDGGKLPEGMSAYTYRHGFATQGLVNGVPIATMAELLGHNDTRMLSAHYGHLEKRADHLRDAATQVIRR